ncbi:hypothetical protein E5554_03750 [Sphingobium sp. PAMC28499]|jgi:predicted flap endonuclease-1-like 5' DNA nuclease|uniref:hypothetical protein n=1 Tax=Sphingobium sp. PAMC28499 TaxID=2565554 RepID=UPI000DB3BE56|nr:hypothetical protein [Sphingobium sp. PAMC28499]PZU69239.1 MAG: hypothetical protein DI554_01990 [Sphingobium sp.]QCB37021.1 hypothetical protein E5554_03750 [Sphingobium sp. PAMC28499]
MQEFFMDYGLWLLIALLVVIGLVFLLSGKGKSAAVEDPAPVAPPVAAEPIAEPVVAPLVATPDPVPVAEPMVAKPVAVEPVVEQAPAPVVEPTPAPIPASPAVAAPSDDADDLLKLKGVGPKLGALLTELGVTRYAQIAGWSDSDIAAIDAKLGNFKGRPVRDQWIEQAKYLAAGDIAGFEAKYGKI